jgi:DNA invertase Pin-like site-specific DNA recombinase
MPSAWSCAGEVGAVLCFDASRLARNGRDWHHLLELCGRVEARVIDLDGVYNPCRPNDRLLLGMKGSISEFELGILRARMLDAARSKARRGELRISVPIGYIWHREIGLGFDPDVPVSIEERHAQSRNLRYYRANNHHRLWSVRIVAA